MRHDVCVKAGIRINGLGEITEKKKLGMQPTLSVR